MKTLGLQITSWRKSSRSGDTGGACVEVAAACWPPMQRFDDGSDFVYVERHAEDQTIDQSGQVRAHELSFNASI